MKEEEYKQYEPIVYERKTGKELYQLDTTVNLTEKEAIQMQIDLSTAKKVFLLRPINKRAAQNAHTGCVSKQ